MTARDFCIWLQGALELIPEGEGLSQEQTELLSRRLYLVFKHEIDSSVETDEQQAKLDAIHGPNHLTGPSVDKKLRPRC